MTFSLLEINQFCNILGSRGLVRLDPCTSHVMQMTLQAPNTRCATREKKKNRSGHSPWRFLNMCRMLA